MDPRGHVERRGGRRGLAPRGANPRRRDRPRLSRCVNELSRGAVLGGDTVTIEIPKAVLQAIQDHAREAYPEECCGFLIGHSSAPLRVVESRRARNVATENRSRRYMVDPLELLR